MSVVIDIAALLRAILATYRDALKAYLTEEGRMAVLTFVNELSERRGLAWEIFLHATPPLRQHRSQVRGQRARYISDRHISQVRADIGGEQGIVGLVAGEAAHQETKVHCRIPGPAAPR